MSETTVSRSHRKLGVKLSVNLKVHKFEQASAFLVCERIDTHFKIRTSTQSAHDNVLQLNTEVKMMRRKSNPSRAFRTNVNMKRLAVILLLSTCMLFAISVIITSVQRSIAHRCVNSVAYRKLYNHLVQVYRNYVCDKREYHPCLHRHTTQVCVFLKANVFLI